MKKVKMDLRIVRYLLLAAALILFIRYFDVLLGGAGRLWSIAYPLILGCIIAYVLNLILWRLEKIYFPKSKAAWAGKTRRPVCIVLSILLIFAVFYLILMLVVPELVKAVMMVAQSIPVMVERGLDWLAEHGGGTAETSAALAKLQIDWESLGENAWNYLKLGLGGVLSSTVSIVSGALGSFVNLVVSLIFAVYILSGKERLAGQGKRIVRAYVKPVWIARGKKLLRTLDETFSSFIVGQVTEAVILGCLCTAGMLLFRFPYAPMVGAFVGATALIPMVGAYLGAGVGAFMILTKDPLKAVLFLLFIVVLQQLEGNLIYPRVVGSSIGLPGLWVLAAVTVGGGLLGVPGMLLGVPLAAACYKLLAENVNARIRAGAGEQAPAAADAEIHAEVHGNAGTDSPGAGK